MLAYLQKQNILTLSLGAKKIIWKLNIEVNHIEIELFPFTYTKQLVSLELEDTTLACSPICKNIIDSSCGRWGIEKLLIIKKIEVHMWDV